MLTDPGELVLDPFAGSCVTGEVAEALDRRWLCCELDETYLAGAKGRFVGNGATSKSTPVRYSIYQPCALEVGTGEPLPADGGAERPAKAVEAALDPRAEPSGPRAGKGDSALRLDLA